MRKCLEKLYKFCEKWELTINLKKTKIMICNHTGSNIKKVFKFGQDNIECTQQYCYLGIEIKSSGSMKTAIQTLSEKARKAMMPLLSTIFQFKLPISKAIDLYQSFIKPISLYNVENWGILSERQLNEIRNGNETLFNTMTNHPTEKVHIKFLKWILGVNMSCSNVAVYGETGTFPLMHHGLVLLIKYWYRLEKMENSSLVQLAYNINKQDNLQWFQTIEFLLEKYNLIDITHVENDSLREKTIKNSIEEKTRVEWEMSLKKNKKLAFYRKFKSSHNFEPYLDNIKFYKDRKIFTKFRCSDHSLEIEKGRHKNLTRGQRICLLCQRQVETEKHYLVYCPKFNKFRKNDFQTKWFQNMTSKENVDIYHIINFLKKAEGIRKLHRT